MAYVDRMYKELATRIINEGHSDKEFHTRGVWPDGSPAHTLKVHNVFFYYDLQKEFPLMTLRKMNWTGMIKEMIWIYQKKSSNVNELGLKIWDAWADENGSIGKSYGYQAGVVHTYKDGNMDQVDKAIYDLKNDPMSRRIVITLYNPADYHEMNMVPCCGMLMFNVRGNILDMQLVQRSWDLLAAGGWDIGAHAFLLLMFAQATGLKPGIFTHNIANAHIYERHIDVITDILTLPEHEAPIVKLNPEITNFYDFTPQDFTVSDYHYNDYNPKFEVSI